MKFIRQTRGKNGYKTKEITEKELIFLIGEDRYQWLLTEDKTAQSMHCGSLIEVNPTPYGTSGDWAGIQW